MIDFSNASVFKLKKTDASKFDSEMRDILIEDEKITAYSVETAGTFGLESELDQYYSGVGRVR